MCELASVADGISQRLQRSGRLALLAALSTAFAALRSRVWFDLTLGPPSYSISVLFLQSHAAVERHSRSYDRVAPCLAVLPCNRIVHNACRMFYLYVACFCRAHRSAERTSPRACVRNQSTPTLRPVHLSRVSLLRVLESNFPGDPLSNSTDMRIPTPDN